MYSLLLDVVCVINQACRPVRVEFFMQTTEQPGAVLCFADDGTETKVGYSKSLAAAASQDIYSLESLETEKWVLLRAVFPH